MSEAWKYMSAYQKLTDGVLDYIMMSNEKGLETSKNLLSRIHNRDLYKCVYESPPEMVFIYIYFFLNWWNRNANNVDVITTEILKKYFIFFLSVITTVDVSILSLSTVLIFEFRIVPMVRYVLLFILLLREYRFSHLFVISFK